MTSHPYDGQVERGVGSLGNGDLTVLILDDTYVPVSAHDTIADVVAHEVTGAGYARATITATVSLSGDTWRAMADSTPSFDLSAVSNRGFVIVARAGIDDASSKLCTWSPDLGPAVDPYEPSWPDGIATDTADTVADELSAHIARLDQHGLPAIDDADAGKALIVNVDGSGYDVTDLPTGSGGLPYLAALCAVDTPVDGSATDVTLIFADGLTEAVAIADLIAGIAAMAEAGVTMYVGFDGEGTYGAGLYTIPGPTDPWVEVPLTSGDQVWFVDAELHARAVNTAGAGGGNLPGAAATKVDADDQLGHRVYFKEPPTPSNFTPTDNTLPGWRAGIDAALGAGGGGGVSLGETSATAYRGDRGKTAYDHSQLTSGNPHGVTKSDVGLGSVTDDAQLKAASNLSDLADAATARTNLGLAIGTDVQAYRALLSNIDLGHCVIPVYGAGTSSSGSWTPAISSNTPILTNGTGANGDYVQWANCATGTGTYTLTAVYLVASALAQFQMSIDGSNVGSTIDAYTGQPNYTAITGLPLSAGLHTVKLTVTGRNAGNTTGYGVRLISLTLMRTA